MHRCPQLSCAKISLSVFMGGGVAPSYILHAQSVHARDTSRASASAQTCPEDIGVFEISHFCAENRAPARFSTSISRFTHNSELPALDYDQNHVRNGR